MNSMEMNVQPDALFHPISNISPCGEDLSFSPEFDQIQEARREDDPTADYGEWAAPLKQADWNTVVVLCIDLLVNRSKDLRLASWLCEGLIKQYGIAGLAPGLRAVSGLIEHFATDVYPQSEDGDDEQRLGTTSWFILRIGDLLRRVPITRAATQNFSLLDDETARSLRAQLQLTSDRDGNIETNPTLEQVAAAVSKTDDDCYQSWMEDAECARERLHELCRVAVAAFGDACPSFKPLTDSLDAIQRRLLAIAKERGLVGRSDDPGTLSKAPQDVPEKSAPVPVGSYGAGLARAQALANLRKVAAFFRDTEPHSPVAYLADKAAKWGEMPLHEWLHEVIKDNSTLSSLNETLGIKVDPGDA